MKTLASLFTINEFVPLMLLFGGDSSVLKLGQVIKRLLAAGSILELAMNNCVLGKDILHLFSIETKQSTRCVALA